MTNSGFWTKNVNKQQNKKANMKILARARNQTQGPLASQSDALPLDHRDK